MNALKMVRLLAGACLVVAIGGAPVALLGQETSAAQNLSAPPEAERSVVAEAARHAELPDSPGAVQSENATATLSVNGQQPQTQPPATQPPPAQSQQAQPAPSQPVQPPVGTAAARTANPSGVAASEPAGAAIAPAKQRRVRTILISVAAIAGTAAAVGIVAGLSAASPSRSPGTH